MAQDGQLSNIRVGHRERDAVAAQLQEAAADGRLSMSELDERLDAALQARTYADLDPLVADLSVAPPSVAVTGPRPAPPQGPPPLGYARDDPLRLDGGVSSDKREGIWTVPPFIRISQGFGSVLVNCLLATPAASVIEIDVVGGAGSVKMILPDGWGVDADRLAKAWGTVSVKVPRQAAPGMPLIVLYGSVGMGTFKVRPPSRRELRKAGLPDLPQLPRH